MSKYATLVLDIFSIFGSPEWELEEIRAIPSNFSMSLEEKEYIRIGIISGEKGPNLNSVSGIVNIDIFTPAGEGDLRASQIADVLDRFMNGKSKATGSGVTQFMASTLSNLGLDSANPALYRSQFSIPFTYFRNN